MSFSKGDIALQQFKVDAGSDSLIETGTSCPKGLSSGSENIDPYVFPGQLDFPFEYFPQINSLHDGLPSNLKLTSPKISKNRFSNILLMIILQLIKKWFE